MLSNSIRRKFIQYFVEQGHRHLPSASVVPHNDPTLLFTNAGMVPFKSYFLGEEQPPTTRVVTAQKCVRVGGKHNDLENVGHTTRHLTFFEMLGNFSFGDYFKKEAIAFAWEVALTVFELDADRIWVSVFEEDDESYELWQKHIPHTRIARLGSKDNFWQMGDTGPCGPCSELLYDRGKGFGNVSHPKEDVLGERFFEFWNLVFMQFNRDRHGVDHHLPKPSVDTGMGFERMVSLKMGVNNVFETDILRHLIHVAEDHFKLNYHEQNKEHKAAFHVIADHLRCLSFAIADGVQPSNIDRGYVLRKILRRAVRYGRTLGAQKPFLAALLPELVRVMGEDYPEIKTSESKIAEILTLEEEGFLRTLRRGGNLLGGIIKKAKDSQMKCIEGDDAFLLKDTYGLPIDEIKLMAKDHDLTVDIHRFKELEDIAKETSKKSRQHISQEVSDALYDNFQKNHPSTEFCGFEKSHVLAKVVGILVDGEWVNELRLNQEGTIFLDRTPFYAEKGGQVGDTGTLHDGEILFDVMNTTAPTSHLIAHYGKQRLGSIEVGDKLTAAINEERRRQIEANHTSTHLLHWALQKVLGEHIKQAGSLVEPDRLRFDFAHHKAVSEDQIIEIEDLINAKIRDNVLLSTYEMPFQEVQNKPDIKQFFGDKYGLNVRVVDIDFSKELCGGCHVRSTGDIGLVRITKESSIAAGIRRIEALSGQAALKFSRESDQMLEDLAKSLKSSKHKLPEKLAQLISDHKNLEEHIASMMKERNEEWIDKLIREKKQIKDVALITGVAPVSKKDLRDFVMQMGQKIASGVCVVCSHEGDTVSAAAYVSKDLVDKKISAKDILSASIAPIGGKGGGKQEFAQAGGTDPSRIPHVFENAKHYLNQL